MSAESAIPVAQVDDLPPRTWRGWWLAWPKWLRIGCWALLGIALLHIAVAIRMAIGLIEADEIAELRKHDSQIRYFWDKQGQRTYGETPYSLFLLFHAGLKGSSCANVEEIWLFDRSDLDRPIADDRDLELIAKHFPYLKSLYVENAEITADGLSKLLACRQLEELSLAFTDVDDDAVERLVDFPRLAKLRLAATRVTDSVIPALQRMKSLKSVDLGSTDVTLAAIEAWKTSAGSRGPAVLTDRRQHLPELLRVSVRWSDGMEDNRFATPDRYCSDWTLTFEGPLDKGQQTPDVLVMRFGSLTQMSISSGDLSPDFADGNYRLTLQLVGVSTGPMTVEIDRNSTTTQRLQFAMPVTREQALERWRQERLSVGK